MKKLFVIRKYIFAKSAADAIKLERRTPPDDVYVDDEWKKQQDLQKEPIGFKK